MTDGNDYEPSPADRKLGITKIRPMPDGYTVVHVDLQKARQDREAYLQRVDQMIDDHIGLPSGAYPDLRPVVKEMARLQLDRSANAIGFSPIRFIVVDEKMKLTDHFNISVDIEKEKDFGTQLAESLGEEAQARFMNIVKLHEEGHTIGKYWGLNEAGADFYAAVKLLKTDSGAQEMLQFMSDARLYNVLAPDSDHSDPHDGGTYLAISRALALTQAEIDDMNEEEVVAHAARFDALAGNRTNPSEFSVKNDILAEMAHIHDKTGRNPPLKQAVDNLVRKDIYAKDNQIAGDDDAMKYETLVKFSQALDRLEQKGINFPEEKFVQKVQSMQLLSTTPKPPTLES